MAKAKYVNRGEVYPVEHTASGDVAVDDVVVLGGVSTKKASLGVAMKNVADGETVGAAIATGGTFEFPKVSGAVILAGQGVNWDADAGEVDDNAAAPAAGDLVEFGKAMQDAGDGVTTIEVDITESGIFT